MSFSHAEIEIYNFHFAIVCAFSQVCKVPGSKMCLALTRHTSTHLSEILCDYRHPLLKNSKEQKSVSCCEKLQEADHYVLATRFGRPPPLKWDANLRVRLNCNRYPEEFSSDVLESLPSHSQSLTSLWRPLQTGHSSHVQPSGMRISEAQRKGESSLQRERPLVWKWWRQDSTLGQADCGARALCSDATVHMLSYYHI